MADAFAFWIHVTPRASRQAVGGRHGEALRVAVQAPPVEGRANAACVAALAEAFGVRSRAVELDPGARGRRKRVRIQGPTGELARRFEELAEGAAQG
ncbi:MAG: DUF167 domain-containing protein [Myxococcota bacterium]|nr:DUF167 domain-containing protein [Myxococcota bacterium]